MTARYYERLILPRVYPILDTALLDRFNLGWLDTAEALAAGGARILQLRQKDNWTRETYHVATELASFCRAADVILIINDRADIARMLRAGVHIGQDDLPPANARAVAGVDAPLGFSTHNEAQLAAAAVEPIDYIALGPIFSTASKANPDPVVGVDLLRRLRPVARVPLVAIGGITLEAAPEVWRAGGDSIAIIGDLLRTPTIHGVRSRFEAWMDQASRC